jgi:hypothetical protein
MTKAPQGLLHILLCMNLAVIKFFIIPMGNYAKQWTTATPTDKRMIEFLQIGKVTSVGWISLIPRKTQEAEKQTPEVPPSSSYSFSSSYNIVAV